MAATAASRRAVPSSSSHKHHPEKNASPATLALAAMEPASSKARNKQRQRRTKHKPPSQKRTFFSPGRRRLWQNPVVLAWVMLCLLVFYGILAVAVYFLWFRDSFPTGNNGLRQHPLFHQRPSLGMTKEEQRERLQTLQRERLSKVQPRAINHHQQQHDNKSNHNNNDDGDTTAVEEPHHHHHHPPSSHKTVEFHRKYPKMIHFLHIHKSAGTFMCKQAFRNKLAADYGRNCNVRDDQLCCGYQALNQKKKNQSSSSSSSHAARYNETLLVEEAMRFSRDAPFDFVASEKAWVGPLLPDRFDYVVSLRDSQDRYTSHWRHLVRNAEARKQAVRAVRSRLQPTQQQQQPRQEPPPKPHRGKGYGVSEQVQSPPTDNANEMDRTTATATTPSHQGWLAWMTSFGSWWPHPPPPPAAPRRRARWADTGDDDPVHWNWTIVDVADGSIHPVGNVTKWMAGQPDNYNLRMICGTACAETPKYGITRELWEFSLRRLWEDVSHVLLVEDMEATFARFAEAYGWEAPDAAAFPKKKHTDSQARDDDSTWDPYMTVLDDALYELALRKYREASSSSNSNSTQQRPHHQRLVWSGEYSPFRNQDMVDEYFRKGPLKNCTNPCCGYCSTW